MTDDQALDEWADAQISADKVDRKIDKMERYKDRHYDDLYERSTQFNGQTARRYENLAKKELENAKLHARIGNSEAVAKDQEWAIKYKKAAKKARNQEIADQMAYNEMQKQLASTKKYQAQQQSKADAIKAERERRAKRDKNPAYKAAKSFTSSWKLGADDIKKTASKGASFVKNLFK